VYIKLNVIAYNKFLFLIKVSINNKIYFYNLSECYANRGVELEDLNYYEYVSHIDVIQNQEKYNNSENSSDDLYDNNTADNNNNNLCCAGRPSSSKFKFLPDFPMAAQYTQRLRVKPLIPTFAGMRPARHPGIYKNNEHC